MRRIDPASWERAGIYDFFSGVSNPFYMVTFKVDVTEARAWSKRTGHSFYLTMTWLCARAVNAVENFRYTIRDGEIWLLDERHPSFTDLHPGSELFHITTQRMLPDPAAFTETARAKSLAQTSFIEHGDETDDLIFISCLPRLRLTGLTNERNLLAPGSAESNIPSLSWGSYEKVGDRLELCLSMEVNHRFVDGVHIQHFAEALEREIEALARR